MSGTVIRLGSLALLLGLLAAIYVAVEFRGNRSSDPPPARRTTADTAPLSRDPATTRAGTAAPGAANEFAPAQPSSAAESDGFPPDRLYATYKDAANSGNLHAQYVLMTVLKSCLRGPKTAEKVAELKASGLAAEVLQGIEARFERCRPLYKAVPQLEQEYQRHYDALTSSKHPLLLAKKRQIPLGEKKQLVLNAISERYPEAYLYADAYLEAALLYRDYPEALDASREEAWLLLYCEASLSCDGRKEREYLRTVKYHAHEYDEVIARYPEISAAIRREDWAALGL